MTNEKTSITRNVLASTLIALVVSCSDGDEDPKEQGTDTAVADDGTGTGTADGAFVFDEDPASAYVRVDRLGMPGVATALITSKSEYNAGDPAADGDFAPEITASVETFHAALDDDLAAAGLSPCAPADCVAAAAPLVIPDVIQIDASSPAGFPNGRQLTDPVMDVVLALLLLDLTMHDVGVLASVPINPPANDVAFSAEFPYLAPVHES